MQTMFDWLYTFYGIGSIMQSLDFNNSTLVSSPGKELVLSQLTNNSTIIIQLNESLAHDESIFDPRLIYVILGWLLSQIGEYIKYYRDTTEKNKKILSLLKQDWENNQLIVQRNITLIDTENSLPEDKHLVPPLEFLETEFWDLIKSNLPNELISGDRLVTVRNIATRIDRVNVRIQSREDFRNSNNGMSNFSSSLRIYNTDLKREMNELLPILNSYLLTYDHDRLREIVFWERIHNLLTPSPRRWF